MHLVGFGCLVGWQVEPLHGASAEGRERPKDPKDPLLLRSNDPRGDLGRLARLELELDIGRCSPAPLADIFVATRTRPPKNAFPSSVRSDIFVAPGTEA